MTTRRSPARLVVLGACLVCSCWSMAASAEELEWRTDYAKARQEAQSSGRPLLIDCVTDNCYWCKQLEQQTFHDAAVAALLGERFVPLRLDATRNADLIDKLHIQNFPTLLFAAPDGRIIGYQEGFVEAARFREQLQRTLSAVTVPEWMTRDYDDAVRSIDAKDYAKALSLLRNIVEDGKDRPVQVKCRQLLQDLEKQATARLAEAKRLADKGQTAEAMRTATEASQTFTGSQAGREAAHLASILSAKPDAADGALRRGRARDLLALAREDYRTQQFLCCLDRCETVATQFGDQPEATEAAQLSHDVKSNPEWAKQASDQLADRLCDLYVSLAEAWLKKGQPQQAVFYLERVVQAFPNSSQAQAAQARLAQIQGPPSRVGDKQER
jgi:thioredoxin-related protein